MTMTRNPMRTLLKQSVGGKQPDPHQKTRADADEDPDNAMDLRKRAFPLIDLLTKAAARNADVMWDVER